MSTTPAGELVKDWQSLLSDAMENPGGKSFARLPFGDVFLEGCHRASLWMVAAIGLRGVIAITSVGSQDGRPPVAAGLARALVRNVSGRVILADLDFGRGGQAQQFGVALQPGLGECLAYASSPRLVPAEPSGRLWLLPAGGRSTFTSNRLIDVMVASRLLEALREHFTFVVLDLPPLEEAPEIVPRLNGIVDGYVLVGRYRGTQVRALRAAADRLAESRRPVGLVMAHDRSRIPRWVGKFLDWTSASAVAETPATSVPADPAISWESPASAAAPEGAAQPAVRPKRHHWVPRNPWQRAAAFASMVCIIGFAAIVMHAKQLPPSNVSSSHRPGVDAGKQAPTLSALLDTGSVEATKPSTLPSPSATPEPTPLPATSHDRTVPTVVVPSSHPAPAPAPAPTPAPTPTPTPAPVADAPPAVILTVTPLSGLAPLTVTADASQSSDPDASGIASYEFNFGDGIVIRSMRGSAAATHTYCQAGIYRLSVIVTDTTGLRSTAFFYVEIIQPVNPVSC